MKREADRGGDGRNNVQTAEFKQHIRDGHIITFMLDDPNAVKLEQGIVLDQSLHHFLNASFEAATSVIHVIDNAKHMPPTSASHPGRNFRG